MLNPEPSLSIFTRPTSISVERQRYLGSNLLGRPVSEIDTVKVFESGNEAIEWILEKRDCEHEIRLILPFLFSARLEDINRGFNATLIASIGNNTEHRSPRTVDKHHGVSADPNTGEIFSINIKFGEHDNPLFDRGIAWLTFPDEELPVLSFTILRGNHNYQALRSGFDRLGTKVEKVLKNLTGFNNPEMEE